MTVKELCKCVVSEIRISFDEDPHDGVIDVIIPVSSNAEDILGEGILNLNVHLVKATDDAIVISTFSR